MKESDEECEGVTNGERLAKVANGNVVRQKGSGCSRAWQRKCSSRDNVLGSKVLKVIFLSRSRLLWRGKIGIGCF